MRRALNGQKWRFPNPPGSDGGRVPHGHLVVGAAGQGAGAGVRKENITTRYDLSICNPSDYNKNVTKLSALRAKGRGLGGR